MGPQSSIKIDIWKETGTTTILNKNGIDVANNTIQTKASPVMNHNMYNTNNNSTSSTIASNSTPNTSTKSLRSLPLELRLDIAEYAGLDAASLETTFRR